MSKIVLKFLLVFSSFFALLPAGCQNDKNKTVDFSTIQKLDLERYMGTWYEIARFDHSFERGLVGVTATYQLRPDGKIVVVNAGYKNSLDGKYSEAKGKAKQPNPESPGKLKVAFFLFFYADYYILELDENYQWALIGSSSDKYLWILSRTPSLDKPELDIVLQKAAERGYNVGNLIWVEQKK
ncbi:apolipoprotein D and lipocalin family protein [Mariniphaga anaerophila]|uniref:Apolipoprotein D and lipocalin family protein n=1 Tax=Mariniphaga anaerophila TaxID=1484053 RepID=A0A1M4WGE7_9BACT|nr:lipocalin family protein [Mariniphaga anaerophila]SHE80328.1 apolipoprotein D and lipocalin family protein [Mariniphaga anaerophila]